MCGRFTLGTPAQTIQSLFELSETPTLAPRYNIAPTNPVAVVRAPAQDAPREMVLLRWGLIPPWAKEPSVGSRMINARSETVATSPAFRGALRRRRCLVVADGFYEWQRRPGGKQPFHFRMHDGSPFAFAGLWEHWAGPEGQAIESCTLLTTNPSELVRPVHDRMPVILEPADYELWLDPAMHNAERLKPLLHPFTADKMVAYPVSMLVNSPSNDDPQCIVPLEA